MFKSDPHWCPPIGALSQKFSKCGGYCPVEGVSWELASAFIRNLNETTGKKFRLPTEAEWEYAARSGGKKEKWAGTSDQSLLSAYAWYDSNSGGSVHRVGQKKPNGLGLYDMSGNTWEWVADWYNKNYYSISPKENPQGPEHGTHKLLRGGSWFYPALNARASLRMDVDPAGIRYGHDYFSFRVAISSN